MNANYTFPNNDRRTVSDFYYFKNMNNNNGASIPMQTVTIPPKGPKRRNSSEHQAAKYVQCILPVLCILQVINIVTVSVCFYLYKVTLDDYGTLERSFQTLRHDLESEMQAYNHTINDKIRETRVLAQSLQSVAGELTRANKSLYDYDAPDYDTYDDESDDPVTPSPIPVRINSSAMSTIPVRVQSPGAQDSQEQDNHRPSIYLPKSTTHGHRKPSPDTLIHADTPLHTDEEKDHAKIDSGTDQTEDDFEGYDDTEEEKDGSDATPREGANATTEGRHARSIKIEQTDPYEDIDIDKNDAEGDYKDIPVPVAPRARKLHRIADTGEKVNYKKTSPSKHHASLNSSVPASHFEPSQEQIEDSVMVPLRRSLVGSERKLAPFEMVAIHLVGDTSKYKDKKDKQYDANHRMYHKGHIKDWKVDSRVTTDEKMIDQHFLLDNGYLKVKQAGLYFVYAQIFYSTKQDTSGFHILINENVMMRCITSGVSSDQMEGSHTITPNSCYTAGLMRIAPGDIVSIKEAQRDRYTYFEPSSCFFGLFKLG